MKTKFLTLFALICFVTNAQVLTINDGVVVEDGDVFTYDELDEEMLITVTNNTSENIFTKIIVESISNNEDGDDLQLCYGGLCYSTIQEGASYPSSGAVVIVPGRTNNQNDHFINSGAGDVSNQPVSYTLKFVQVDTSEQIIDGSEISFTYAYAGNLATSDLNAQGRVRLLKNSIVNEYLAVNVARQGVLSIYNLNGQKVHVESIDSNHTLNVTSLAKGYYIAVFETKDDKITQKFLKK